MWRHRAQQRSTPVKREAVIAGLASEGMALLSRKSRRGFKPLCVTAEVNSIFMRIFLICVTAEVDSIFIRNFLRTMMTSRKAGLMTAAMMALMAFCSLVQGILLSGLRGRVSLDQRAVEVAARQCTAEPNCIPSIDNLVRLASGYCTCHSCCRCRPNTHYFGVASTGIFLTT